MEEQAGDLLKQLAAKLELVLSNLFFDELTFFTQLVR